MQLVVRRGKVGVMLLIGRKAICNGTGMSWKTIKRKKKCYSLPIRQFPPNKPYLDTDEFRAWAEKYDNIITQKDDLTPI